MFSNVFQSFFCENCVDLLHKLTLPGIYLFLECTFFLEFIVGLSRLIDLNRIESIQVVNRLIDLLKRSTIVTSSMVILLENANKLIFIRHNNNIIILQLLADVL